MQSLPAVSSRSAWAATLVCLSLALGGCASGDDEGSGDTPSPAVSTSAASGSATSSSTTSPAERPSQDGVVEVAVSVRDGQVEPPTHRVKVDKGSRVRLQVTSDTDDEVHVHGYEIEKELSAGQTTKITFTADQAGLFEVETHESELQLLQLEVR